LLGRLKDLTVNRDGTQNITVTVQADVREMYDDLREKDIDIEIKRHYAKRSLDASAKSWVMIDQLAEKLGKTKKEIYREAIKEIGGVSDVVCVIDSAVETLCRNWETKGQGWMTEVAPSKIPGCKNVTLWYGSSCYNTKQMSTLIDQLIQECNQQGIPTMRDEEVDRLLKQWNKKKEKEDEKLDSSTDDS